MDGMRALPPPPVKLSVMAPSTSNAPGKRTVSVDDDADIDDLDDVLDDFTPKSTAKPAPQPTTATKAATAPSPSPPGSTRTSDSQDMHFVEQLAREMEAMLLGLGTQPGPSGSAGSAHANDAHAGEDSARDKQVLEAWGELFAKSLDGVPLDVTDGDGANEADESKDAFRKSRDEAAARLRKSHTELQADPSTSDELATLLESEDEESLQKFLEAMMGQLMSKDVLYEPLKELNNKFPSYLESNKDKLSASEVQRYQAQYACSSEIIALFEETVYNDDDPEMRVRITTLMSKVPTTLSLLSVYARQRANHCSQMQEHGAPPAEIMGELPPGLDLGPDGAPQLPLPDGCVIG
ncbi:Pex19 protein family-domain-containing protein [Russula earlei]|uniref:Pex19 protein family-domain-containing protein n=1 Tax=Russula earlei TaxID=71964 RepID=A0ACC0UKC7_9AGAM|nr:Pex19 protein family-domain-containing protein [Russula earlei]